MTKIQNPNHALGMNNRWRYAGKEEQRFGPAGAFSPAANAPFSGSGSLDLSLLDFGARMYDPFVARWTAVDPLAIKFLSSSTSSYCIGNPILLRDPDGKTVVIIYFENNTRLSFTYTGKETNIPDNFYVRDFIEAYKFNKDNWEKAGLSGQSPSTQLVENNNIKVYIYEDYGRSSEFFQENGGIPYTIWNSTEGLCTDNGVILSPATALSHEADHAVDDLTNAKAHSDRRKDKSCTEYTNAEEKRVITGSEQKTARANGEIKPGQVTRKNHRGHTVFTSGPIYHDVVYDPKKKKKR